MSLASLFSFRRKNKADSNHVRSVNAASSNWPDDAKSFAPSADIRGASQTVSQRVASLYLNDPVVRSGVNLLVSSIVGSGCRLNTPDQVIDAVFNSARIDPSRRMSSAALQRAFIRSIALAGEALALHRLIGGSYACQILDPEQLDRSKNEDFGNGGGIVAGVEKTFDGRIVAYWILPQAPGDPFARAIQSRRFPASEVIHIFEQEFPGQVRGISPFTPVLSVLNQASIAIEARLKQLQVSAMLTAILTSPDGTDPFEGNPNASLEPGAIIRARPGEDVSVVNGPQSPEFNSFMKVLYRQVAAALGLTYEDLIGDLEGVNYSSFRGGALTARRKAEAQRKVLLIEGFLQPVSERWQAIEVFSGRQRQIVNAGWIEPAWPQVDPAKEADAEIALLDAGLKSRREIIEARGREFETVQAEIDADEPRTPKTPAIAKPDEVVE